MLARFFAIMYRKNQPHFSEKFDKLQQRICHCSTAAVEGALEEGTLDCGGVRLQFLSNMRFLCIW